MKKNQEFFQLGYWKYKIRLSHFPLLGTGEDASKELSGKYLRKVIRIN